MSSSPPRRPRFLSAVPADPEVQPASFSPAAPPPPAAARARAGSAPARSEAPSGEHGNARHETLERVANAVEMLRLQSERLAEQARADALEIAFQIAGRILEAELRTGPEALFSLVRSALRRAGDSRRVQVRLSPADATLVESESGQAALSGYALARVEIVPDPSLAAGDVVVETDFGKVDGRLATRLGELRRAAQLAVEGDAA